MSFEPPEGILDIGNATLRVGKLEVAETSGLNQGLLNIVKNDLLITENTEYIKDHKWGIKLPTTWVAEFEVKGHSGKYIDFNFYNENSASNAQGYNLTFMDTSLTLKYDGGNPLPITGDTVDSTLSLGDAGYGVATIPTIVGAYRKVNIFFERGVISVSIDGTRYLYFKESDGYNAVHGHPGVASRVVSTTGSAFVNVFIESDNENNSKFKNLRIVNGRFISDKTSNIAFIGGNLGVGVNSPKETLDIRGNMHLTRVSNVSQIKVDSNVVTEYTGPHDRPMRKYPEVAFPLSTSSESAASGATTFTYKGYTVTSNSVYSGTAYKISNAFDGTATSWSGNLGDYDSNGDVASGRTANYLQIQLPNAIKLENIKIISEANYEYANGPRNITLYGSNNGSNWVTLKTETDLPLDGGTTNPDPQTAFVHVNTTTKYLYYKLEISKIYISSGGATYARIGEWELYGHEEGSGSLDTTLKTVYNVPATTGTQLEVYYDGQDYTGVTSTVTDKAGTATNATITNTGSTITFNNEYKAWTFGGTDPGPGVESTRTDTFIATMPSSFSGNQVHSVSTWFRYEQTFGDDAIFSISPSNGEDTNKSIGVRLNEGQDYEIKYYHWSNDLHVNFPRGHTANTWYHMVVTYTGSITDERRGKSVYINGELCPFVSETTTGELNLDGSDRLQLARRNDGLKEFFGSIANFRIYTKCLNIDQVKELYDYQKDYFLGSKSQVTLYKGHLGVGVTEPSGQLELAGDERIQEYPPGPMDGYETLIPGHGVFCAYVSSFYTTTNYFAWYAFDKTDATFWVSDDTDTPETYDQTTGLYTGTRRLSEESVLGEYIILKLPYSINLKSFTMGVRSTELLRGPKSGIVYGRKNNKWEVVHSFSGVTYTASERQNIQVINPNEYYNEFALVTTALAPNGSTYHNINLTELRYFGTPGPTTLDKGSLTLGRSLDVPRISRYDVDTETPRPEKLVVDFDTTVNSSPTDISGKGNHGRFVNGASYSPADKAFEFVPGTNGTNNGDHIQVTLNNTAGAWAHSLSVWVKLDDANANGQALMGIGETTARKNSVLYIYAGSSASTKELQYSNHNTDTLVIPNGNVNFVIGRWYHIVVTTNSGTISSSNQKMYVDGIEQPTAVVGTASGLSLDSLDANDNLFIGRQSANYAGNWFDGQMSNYKIYSVALEPSEVRKLYNLGRTGRSMVISDTAVGIGKVPEAQLDVRGNMKVSGTISSNSPGWSYWRSSGADINDAIYNSATDGPVGGFTTLSSFGQNWETGISGVISDRGTGHNFNPTTGVYTAPEKGVYMVNFNFSISGGSGSDDSMYVQFTTTGNSDGGGWETGGAFINRSTGTNAFMLLNAQFSTRSGIETCYAINDIVLLDAGSTVNVRFENVSVSSTLTLERCNFSGFKIA